MFFYKKRIIKKYKEKLKRNRERNLKCIQSEKNRISNILRHDIKTALLAQIHSLELILKEKLGKITEEQKEVISQNINSNYFLLHLIVNTIFILNYENENYKLKIENIDLLKEIDICLKEIQNYANDKEQNIVINAPKKIKLNADKKLVQRIITNILTSSVTNGFEKSKIEINITENKNSISFSTKNKSVYMTKEKMESLFEENKDHPCDFNRLGMSLNLNIAKKLIKAHNWNLIAKSREDNSSTFGFVIKK